MILQVLRLCISPQKFADLGISYKLLKIGKFLQMTEKVFKQAFLDFDSMDLKKAEEVDKLTSSILVKQLDVMNSEVSIKDKRFLNVKPQANVKRSEKIGHCYFTSVLFDDYMEYFVQENITDFRVRGLDLYCTEDKIVGLQCVYVTKEEEIEAPSHIATGNGVKKISIEFKPKEFITEIYGELDKQDNISALTLTTNLGNSWTAGGKGGKKFKLQPPSSGYILVGVGGSFRSKGIDSLYFYYL